MISEEAKDTIKELLNIYIGQAASLLSEMVNKKINLSIPQVNFIDINSSREHIIENLPQFFREPLMASTISFGDKIIGSAKLVFSTSKIKHLVFLCTGEDIEEDEYDSDDFNDTDLDVLKEIGNVILNSFLGGFSNLVEIKLDYTIPEIVMYNSKEDKELLFKASDVCIIVSYVSFNIDETKIDGAILCTFAFESVPFLLNKLEIIKDEYYGK